MKTPLLSTYSQQLWVIGKLLTSNNDGIVADTKGLRNSVSLKLFQRRIKYSLHFADERYDKSFQVSISIDGIAIDRKLVPILSSETGHNRYVYIGNMFTT